MTEPDESTILASLETKFLDAMEALRDSRQRDAEKLLREIVRAEPRLPEPHMELAVLSYGSGDLESAVDEARMAVELLDKGGQWSEDLPPNVMNSHARNLLGEILVELAQSDDVVFDKERFADLWNEACSHFRLAYEGDPNNEDARRNALLHQPVDPDDEDLHN